MISYFTTNKKIIKIEYFKSNINPKYLLNFYLSGK